MKTLIRKSSIYFGARYLHGKTFIPPRPQLSLSDKCNFKCQMCWMHSDLAQVSNNPEKLLFSKSPPKILQYQDFLKIADGLAETKTPFVSICGKGEPLLNPNAIPMFSYLNQKKINFSLTTNGSLLLPKSSLALLRTGIKAINISLDSVAPENYLKIHGIKSPKLSEIMSNITFLKKTRDRANYKTRIEVSFVISKLNLHEIPKIAEITQKFADRITFINCNVYPEIAHLALSNEDYFKLRDKYNPQLKIPNNWQKFLNKVERMTREQTPRFYLKDYFSRHSCKVPYSFCVIHSDGRVTPCCPTAYVVGNATQTSFKSIWNSKRFNHFRYSAYNLPKLKRELPLSWCYCCGHF